MDRTPWITPHIWEVRGTPFNLNVEAYDKAISWGTSLISIFFHKNTGAMDIKSIRRTIKGKGVFKLYNFESIFLLTTIFKVQKQVVGNRASIQQPYNCSELYTLLVIKQPIIGASCKHI